MSFSKNVTGLSGIRPMLNLGCLFDISTGSYVIGQKGESILNGGLPYIEGLGGRGNTNKSILLHWRVIRIMDRYGPRKDSPEKKAHNQTYDTENSAGVSRYIGLARHTAPRLIEEGTFYNDAHFLYTDTTEYDGTSWFEMWKEAVNDRIKNRKNILIKTPLIDPKTGENIMIPPIVVTEVDSLSKFRSASVGKIQDRAGVGESERNVEALRDAAAKAQLLNELPQLTAKGGVYIMMTAHLGDNITMDPMAPPMKKLAFLKQNLKFKHVPEPFTFLTNNLWIVTNVTPLINQTTKAPEFPRGTADSMKGDTDLLLLSMMLVRCKSGPSGIPIEVVISQSEGVQIGLTEFNYIRKYERFGLEGNDRNYQLSLLPDVNLSRTTIRGKCLESAKVQRALEITSELCQMHNYWHHLPDGFLCTAKELYDDLKAKGYDWDVILTTRGYWVPDQYEHPIPFLSTMDLLNMRAGSYVPYWMNNDEIGTKSKPK